MENKYHNKMFNVDFGAGKIAIKLKDNTFQNLKNEIEKYINDISLYNVVNGDNEIINEKTDLDRLKNHEILVTLKGNTINEEEIYYNKKNDDLINVINVNLQKYNDLLVKNQIMEKKYEDLVEKIRNAEKELTKVEIQIKNKEKTLDEINHKCEQIYINYLNSEKKMLQSNEENFKEKIDKGIKQNEIIKQNQIKVKEFNKQIEEKKKNINLLNLKIKKYNQIIQNQEELKKDLYKEINLKKNLEDIKNQYLNEISKNIQLYLNKIQQKFLKKIQKINDEKIEFYINKWIQNRNLRFKEEEEKYKNIKLSLFEEYKEKNIIHFNKKCNKCQDNPIKGILYQCSHCNDYYLCEQCEQINYLDKIHPYNFIKIRKYSNK